MSASTTRAPGADPMHRDSPPRVGRVLYARVGDPFFEDKCVVIRLFDSAAKLVYQTPGVSVDRRDRDGAMAVALKTLSDGLARISGAAIDRASQGLRRRPARQIVDALRKEVSHALNVATEPVDTAQQLRTVDERLAAEEMITSAFREAMAQVDAGLNELARAAGRQEVRGSS